MRRLGNCKQSLNMKAEQYGGRRRWGHRFCDTKLQDWFKYRSIVEMRSRDKGYKCDKIDNRSEYWE